MAARVIFSSATPALQTVLPIPLPARKPPGQMLTAQTLEPAAILMRTTTSKTRAAALASALLLTAALDQALAVSTINATNQFAYGANIGWLNWRGDTNNGAIIGEYVCSGCIYSANVGWINLGSGAPANGIRYQNNSGTDFGVNHDGLGNLRGYAYGPNIGWIN